MIKYRLKINVNKSKWVGRGEQTCKPYRARRKNHRVRNELMPRINYVCTAFQETMPCVRQQKTEV